MNLSPRWVDVLVRAGFDAVHWSAVGNPRATDREIMAHATQLGFVVLTHDLDFGSILAATNLAAPSVVQIRADDLSPESLATALLTALRQMRSELVAGALVTVDVARTRVRVLPLNRPD